MIQHCFLRSFSTEPTLKEGLFDLLELCFPGLKQAEQHNLNLGLSWETVSTPFLFFHNELPVTHVGVLEIPLVVMGEMVRVGGIHGVCTRPEYRRRGYYRQVMEEVLQYCEHRYKTLILTTAQPELYEPFGFRVLQEHIFVLRCVLTGGRNGFRLLNSKDPGDLQILNRLLEIREPISNVVGVVQEKAVFAFNEGLRPLYYAPDLDMIVSLELEGTQLKLFDIVAPQIYPLGTLLERLPYRIDEVVIYFSPDRLAVETSAIPYVLLDSPEMPGGAGKSFLMARGPFAAEGRPFMLPRPARC